MAAADAQPICEPPRTTLGLPIATQSPRSTAARATSSVVGNSQMRAPSARNSSRSATDESSWLAIGSPASRAAAAIRCSAAGTCGAAPPMRSASVRNAATVMLARSLNFAAVTGSATLRRIDGV